MSELAVLNESQGVSVFNSMDAFQQAQRMVVPLMQSTMVPEIYRGSAANCMVAMEMSHRVKISVLEVMQNMQIVKGNVGWKSEYVINKINASGFFEDSLDFVFSEDRKSCYAIATRKSNGKQLRGTSVTMEMAKVEGWLDKNGSKWKTMEEQMLMYRSATFFCRVYCPEVLAGVQTSDEIIDIGYVEPTNNSAIEKLNNIVKPEAESIIYETFSEVTEDPIVPDPIQQTTTSEIIDDDDDF
jgi:hypothetical protein